MVVTMVWAQKGLDRVLTVSTGTSACSACKLQQTGTQAALRGIDNQNHTIGLQACAAAAAAPVISSGHYVVQEGEGVQVASTIHDTVHLLHSLPI